jgi:uncharacterized protein YsxB (DUF464 family)
MINISIFKHNDLVIGFEANGHAGYAKNGKDIICSATTVLFITTINSLENLTEVKIEYRVDDGYAKCKLIDEPNSATQLLLESMLIGLTGILETYGKKYINLKFEEV